MTDIAKMAREAGLGPILFRREAEFEHFASIVRAAALEEAAEVCEHQRQPIPKRDGERITPTTGYNAGCDFCALEIRALAKQDKQGEQTP